MIHATAIVSPAATLAADVEVGPYSIVGAGVQLGRGCRVGPHAVLQGPTIIGEENQIFQFASIGDAPQDLKYKGEATQLIIGDRNTFREYCSVNRGTVHGGGVTRVGSDNLFMANTHVAHDCRVGSRCVLANGATLGGHVELGDWVIMGGFSGVHQFGKVGAHAFIANNCAVTRDVPPYVMAVGQPAAPHSVNSKGLERRGYTAEQIRHIKDAFRVLYRSDLPLAQALQELTARLPNQPELKPFVDFIAVSDRSIIR